MNYESIKDLFASPVPRSEMIFWILFTASEKNIHGIFLSSFLKFPQCAARHRKKFRSLKIAWLSFCWPFKVTLLMRFRQHRMLEKSPNPSQMSFSSQRHVKRSRLTDQTQMWHTQPYVDHVDKSWKYGKSNEEKDFLGFSSKRQFYDRLFSHSVRYELSLFCWNVVNVHAVQLSCASFGEPATHNECHKWWELPSPLCDAIDMPAIQERFSQLFRRL